MAPRPQDGRAARDVARARPRLANSDRAHSVRARWCQALGHPRSVRRTRRKEHRDVRHDTAEAHPTHGRRRARSPSGSSPAATASPAPRADRVATTTPCDDPADGRSRVLGRGSAGRSARLGPASAATRPSSRATRSPASRRRPRRSCRAPRSSRRDRRRRPRRLRGSRDDCRRLASDRLRRQVVQRRQRREPLTTGEPRPDATLTLAPGRRQHSHVGPSQRTSERAARRARSAGSRAPT